MVIFGAKISICLLRQKDIGEASNLFSLEVVVLNDWDDQTKESGGGRVY